MAEESAAVKARPVAELRHDLRTPLNHIIGYGEMLIEDAEDRGDAATAGTLRQIHATAQELVGVIQHTLTPNKTEVTDAELAGLRARLQEPVQGIVDRATALIAGSAEGS